VDARDAALALAASSGHLATLLVGLAIATALWSGVQALNDHARKTMRARPRGQRRDARALVSTRGAYSRKTSISAAPRRLEGFAVLEGTVRVGDKSLRLIGVEPLTLPRGARLVSLREGGDRGFS